MIEPVTGLWATPVERLREGRALVAAGEAMQAQAIVDLARTHAWGEGRSIVDVVGTRPVRLGADGTPPVDEHLPLEVAAALGLSVDAAMWLARDVVNVHHRHPRLWRAVQEDGFPLWQARDLAQRCELAGLDRLECLRVDRAVGPALGRLGRRRLLLRLRAAIIAANPDKARAQVERSREGRYVRTGTDADDPGSSWVAGRLDTADARDFDELLDRLVDGMAARGDTGDREALRARAIGVLAGDLGDAQALLDACDVPLDQAAGTAAVEGHVAEKPASGVGHARRPRSSHQLYIHLSGPDPDPDDLADIEGLGPVLAGQLGPLLGDRPVRVTPVVHRAANGGHPQATAARQATATGQSGSALIDQFRLLLGDRHVTVAPVLDLGADRAVDGYTIPDRMRDQVLVRDRWEVFPFSSRRARPCDLDHTDPYRHDGTPGQTRPSNLGPLSRRPHRAKTFGGWKLEQPEPGVFWWTSPHGQLFRVDRAGVRDLTPDPCDAPSDHEARAGPGSAAA